jgi:pimeloyl-ACP methyl ester carboxylesterase
VPDSVEKYSQRRAIDDATDVLNHLKIDKAHIVGLSMGGFAALHFGIHYPDRAFSIVVGAAGMGAEPDKRAQFREEVEIVARRWETEGAEKFAPIYGSGPGREQLEMKDPRGFKEFISQLSEHSPKGAALTLRGVQAKRPSPFELVQQLEKMTVPALIIHGDEDRSCLGTGAFLKRTIPSAGLMVFPKTGHTINLEEPALFNFVLQDFFTQVDSGRWSMRDKRTETPAVLLMPKAIAKKRAADARASVRTTRNVVHPARRLEGVGQFSAKRVNPFARHGGADFDEARAESRRVIGTLANHDPALGIDGGQCFGPQAELRAFDDHEVAVRGIDRHGQARDLVHGFLDGGLVTALDALNVPHPLLLYRKSA